MTLAETCYDSCLGDVQKWSAATGPCWGLLEGRQHGKTASQAFWGSASYYLSRDGLSGGIVMTLAETCYDSCLVEVLKWSSAPGPC